MEGNIGPRECRSSSFISGEEKLLKHREQKERLLTEYEQLIQMYDKACAAAQQELQLLNLKRAAKGSLEVREFPEGRFENMSGTEPVRLGRSSHTQFPERPQERLFTCRSCHYLQDPREMAACSQYEQREPVAVPDFQHREPSGYVRIFTAHDRLDTQGYPQQDTGYSGHTPQFYHYDEAPRFGVPFASPGRREPVMLSDVSPQRRKQKEPDKYDGEKVEWPDYLVHFETIAKGNGWSDGEKGLQLVTCLRGKAQRVLSEIPSGQREDFTTLSEFPARRFNPPNRENAFRFELRQRKKVAKESLMEYGGEVLRLAQKAYPNFPPEAIDQIATDQFVKGLPDPEQKKYVDLENPGSLDAAVSLALQFESFERGESCSIDGRVTKPKVAPVIVNDDKRSSVQEMAQLRQRINQVQQKVELKSERSDSGEGQKIATLTQQVADLTKTVEQLTKLVTDVLTGQRLKRKMRRRGNCFHCGQPGHYKNKCPLRVKNFTPAADAGILGMIFKRRTIVA